MVSLISPIKSDSLKKGFLQAGQLTVYIVIFAFGARTVSEVTRLSSPDPVLAITMFLLAFIISALVSTYLILWHPAILFFEGKRKEAMEIILWSSFWLTVFLLTFLMGSILVE